MQDVVCEFACAGSMHLKCRNVIGFALLCYTMGHFTVVKCVLGYKLLNISETGGDLALIQTSLLFSFNVAIQRPGL